MHLEKRIVIALQSLNTRKALHAIFGSNEKQRDERLSQRLHRRRHRLTSATPEVEQSQKA